MDMQQSGGGGGGYPQGGNMTMGAAESAAFPSSAS